MADKDARNTIIKDSNVEILIAANTPQGTDINAKKTDYWSIIIAMIFLALGIWGLSAGF